MLTKRELTIENIPANRKEILKQIDTILDYMVQGKLKIAIEQEGDDLARIKRRYFAMVKELGIEAGYQSPRDREMFKQQVKVLLKVDSIEKIDKVEDMMHIIEELRHIATIHFNYRRFKSDEGDITFDN